MEKNWTITDKQCTGCHACYSICPKNAIEMKQDEKGFLQPVIKHEFCIACKLCQKTCPLNTPDVADEISTVAYAAYSLDEENHRNSSSGGIFSLLAAEIMQQGGIVYGAAYSKDYEVEHQRMTDDVKPLRTSKYVQSRIGDQYKRAEQDLRNGRKVLFSGTPCQIGGLYRYLQQKKVDVSNLLAVDLICHGVPSPLLWKEHLKKIAHGKKTVAVNFRDKRFSWGGFYLTCQFEDGTEYAVEAGQDTYMQGFFANMTLRDSCYVCQFKTQARAADITLADYWGVEKLDPDMQNRNGTSVVIIHSRKGQVYFDALGNQVRKKKVLLSSILVKNKTMIQSVVPHPRKDRFWNMAMNGGYAQFEEIISQLLKPTLKETVNLQIVKLKRIGKKVLKR